MEYKWFARRGIYKLSLIRFPVVRDELFSYKPRDVEPCHTNALIFVGRIVPVKRLKFLLYAMKIIKRRRPDVKLFIVGPADTHYMQKLKWMINALDLENNVVLIGPLYGNTKYSYIACSKVLVLLSKKRNTHLVLLLKLKHWVCRLYQRTLGRSMSY